MTLNVGLIGYGLGGMAFHAPFISTTPGLHLAAVMTSDPAKRQEVERRYPGTSVVADVAALLALTPRLDLISISSPNATHAPLARQVLAAKRHVVVDKPFAATAAEARELGALAASNGVKAFPFQNRRWDGDYLTLRRLMRDGTIGDIHRFESRFDRWRPVRKPGWCKPDAAALAENIVHDLGTHLIDQALQLFGPVERIYAELRRIDPAVMTSDEMFIALTHTSGTRSHLSSTMSAGIPAPRYHAYGTRGAYLKYGVDPQETALKAGVLPGTAGYGVEPEASWGTFGSGDAPQRVPTEVGNYAPFYAGVARAISDGAPPPVTVDEVAAGLDIIDAAFDSDRRGVVVELK